MKKEKKLEQPSEEPKENITYSHTRIDSKTSWTLKEIDAVLDKYYEEVFKSKSPSMVDLMDLKLFVKKEIGK